MSEVNKKNSNSPDKNKQAPTASFESTVLEPGKQIGPFRIERMLGRGAVGVVYLAHDTKLDRAVAIKGLPAEMMGNPKVRSRFRREARLLAGLNHPNIATIHEELQETKGANYLVMEYIAGETLSERIERGPIKMDKVFSIGIQIAEAMAAAHEQGVIHRDLKPGNIKITPDDKVKVLDFGLAKAVIAEAADQESTITQPGRVIGTPAYMSPEQSRGEEVDHRSDIWSFGCILYEMLTGKIPFKGETVSDTLANILQVSPDWRQLPQATPANIQVLLRRCLEKDLHNRLQSIADAVIEIKETIQLPRVAPPVTRSLATFSAPQSKRRLVAVGLACFTVAAIATGILIWMIKPIPSVSQPITSAVELPWNQKLAQWYPYVAVSPNGTEMVYKGVGEDETTTQLVLREFDKLQGKVLKGTQNITEGPNFFFSPDGKNIAFIISDELYKLSLDGGRRIPLCPAPGACGGDWIDDGSADGRIFLALRGEEMSGIYKVSANESVKETPTSVTTPQQEEQSYLFPQVLPGNQAVLFTIWRNDLDNVSVAVYDRKTEKKTTVLSGVSNARYERNSHCMVYARKGRLYTAPFDLSRYELDKPKEVSLDIDVDQDHSTGMAPFSISNEGILVYIRGGEWQARRTLVKVDRQGNPVDEDKFSSLSPAAYSQPRLSPDEDHLACTLFKDGFVNTCKYDFDREQPSRQKLKTGNINPLWSYDNKKLVLNSKENGIWRIFLKWVDSDQPEEIILESSDHINPTCWSLNGRYLLFNRWTPENLTDVCMIELDKMGQPVGKGKALVDSGVDEFNAVISRDNQWIAYTLRNKSEPQEIRVHQLQGPRDKLVAYGFDALWSPVRDELFYRCGDEIMVVAYKVDSETGEFLPGKPDQVFKERLFYEGNFIRNYDISIDGEYFFFFLESEESAGQQLIMDQNCLRNLMSRIK